jgi:phosphonate transport system substrate-binding protein
VFGVARSHAVPAFRSAFSELCELLSKATGQTFKPYTAPSYRELTREVEQARVTLAWAPPVLALELDDRSLAYPLAVPVRSGMLTYNTALIVRERIPSRLDELRGMRMAWVDRESSSGYIVPRIHLASLGFDPRGLFSHESFQMSHIGVVDAVASGRADIGATFYSQDTAGKLVSAGWTAQDGSTIRSVKIVATAGPIPNDMIVISKSLPATVRSAVQRWLLDLDDRSRQLFSEIIHGSAFRVPSSAHFQPLRGLIAAARTRGLLET